MTTFWTRQELKERAKAGLRVFYWQAFLVCLIAAFLGAGTESSFNFRSKTDARTGDMTISSNPGITFSYGDQEQISVRTPFFQVTRSIEPGIVSLFLKIFLVILIVIAVAGALVSNVLQVGKKRYFLKKTAGICETGPGEMFSAFSEAYWNQVLVMFQQQLYLFLWTLLLVIPGIIKSYEYYMVPYLLAENPHLTGAEARELSSRMTEGSKWDIFVLELSFIGWDILGILLFGIGRIFVAPYKEAVYAELYHKMSEGSGKGMNYGIQDFTL